MSIQWGETHSAGRNGQGCNKRRRHGPPDAILSMLRRLGHHCRCCGGVKKDDGLRLKKMGRGTRYGQGEVREVR